MEKKWDVDLLRGTRGVSWEPVDIRVKGQVEETRKHWRGSKAHSAHSGSNQTCHGERRNQQALEDPNGMMDQAKDMASRHPMGQGGHV